MASGQTLRKVECIVCKKVAFPPVMQCKHWHLVCNPCRENLEDCPDPDCSEKISAATRSGVSEKFLEKHVQRCKYFKDGSGCLEAFLKDEESEDKTKTHEDICELREVICLVPSCEESIRLSSLTAHFEECHQITQNCTAEISFNASEAIMNRKGIVNETCNGKSYKSIVSYMRHGPDIFLAIFRISSLRLPELELSTIVHPYYSNSDSSKTGANACTILISNLDDPIAAYKWEGPLSQSYPITPNFHVKDEAGKLKWSVTVTVLHIQK